jgi:hypothetical protein
LEKYFREKQKKNSRKFRKYTKTKVFVSTLVVISKSWLAI